MSTKTDNTPKVASKSKNKTLWWSLLWANVVMLIVLLLTFLFQRYLYAQMSARLLVDVEINPLIIALGYIVGVLLMWAVVYKLIKVEPAYFDDSNQNHNIY